MRKPKTTIRVTLPIRAKAKAAAKKEKRTLEAFLENAILAALVPPDQK